MEDSIFLDEPMRDFDLNDYKPKRYSPAVYVTTERKQKAGWPSGMWLDLTSFDDYDQFIEVCERLHSDESEPEFIVAKHCNFPERYLESTMLYEDEFDEIREYDGLSESEKEMLDAYCEWKCEIHADMTVVEEACRGKWSNEEEFCEEMAKEWFNIPDDLERYIDYEKMAEDFFFGDFYHDGTFVWDEYC